jgi:hypothetical protein
MANVEQLPVDNAANEIPALADMTDRELLVEIAANLRLVGDVMRQLQGMGPGGMMRMFLGK